MRHGPYGRVLKGHERRKLCQHIAIGRAQFEREYWGEKVVPFDRAYVVSEIPSEYRDNDRRITINISDALVRDCQRLLASWHRTLTEFEGEPTPWAERHPEARR